MHLKPIFKLILATLLVAPVLPVYSQVTPAATQGGAPIVIGGGFSDFLIDYGSSRIGGPSAWIDWYPNRLPAVLNGLGVEIEGRDLNYDRSAGLGSVLRQDTGEGGPIYTWNHFHSFRPYVKYLVGVGSFDFASTGPYRHDTFGVLSPAAGLEYHAWRHIWIRGDYEYQYWHQVLGPHDLNPNGVTVGASYDFRPWVPGQR
jgi:hypothetical protein